MMTWTQLTYSQEALRELPTDVRRRVLLARYKVTALPDRLHAQWIGSTELDHDHESTS